MPSKQSHTTYYTSWFGVEEIRVACTEAGQQTCQDQELTQTRVRLLYERFVIYIALFA